MHRLQVYFSRASFDPATFTGAVAHECLTRYANAVGLARSAVVPLAARAWLIHSRSEYARFVADCGGRPDTLTLRRSLFVGLLNDTVAPGRDY